MVFFWRRAQKFCTIRRECYALLLPLKYYQTFSGSLANTTQLSNCTHYTRRTTESLLAGRAQRQTPQQPSFQRNLILLSKGQSPALLLPLQSDPRHTAIRRRRGAGAHQTAHRGIESVILPPLTSADLD